MFKMFSKKPKGVQDVSPIEQVEEAPSFTQDNFDVKRHIQALLDNDFVTVPAGDDEVTRLVRQLVEKLQSHIMGEMSRCVKISIEANETAIFSAKMLVELKDVEAQTQGIAAASEEMVATVSEIERYGMSIADQAQDAQNSTKSGSSAVQNAVENMEHITSSVQKGVEQVSILAGFTDEISGIADDIKKIAEQTNLLALNATIEAARAGDAGKGFAVVAGEVKILSGETAKSTESINEIIANLQNATMNISQSMENSTRAIATGREAMTGLGDGMGEINEKINIVTENIAQISNVLGEQNQASSEVAQGVVLIAAAGRKSVAGIEHIVNSMDKVEGLISGQIGALAEYDVPNKVVKLAQSDHILWKKRLANMVAGREGLNADELADHHSCRLGKWYDTVSDSAYLDNPVFQELQKPHELVHTHGIEAVKLYNSGKTKEAMVEIALVEDASKDVLRLLAELENIVS